MLDDNLKSQQFIGLQGIYFLKLQFVHLSIQNSQNYVEVIK